QPEARRPLDRAADPAGRAAGPDLQLTAAPAGAGAHLSVPPTCPRPLRWPSARDAPEAGARVHRAAAAVVGNLSVNTAPFGRRSPTEIRPPRRLIRSRAIERPRPVPFRPLVVKNGSKIRSRSAAGTPQPSSSTLITT